MADRRDRDRRSSKTEPASSETRRRSNKSSREKESTRESTRGAPSAIVDEPQDYRENLDMRPQYASPSTFLRPSKSSASATGQGQYAQSPSGSYSLGDPTSSRPRGYNPDGERDRARYGEGRDRGEGVRLRGYSSSSSSSYIDISRTFPAKRPRGIGAIRAFFTTPPEHRRGLRRRKSRRGLAFGSKNSSSSSINSDLAYGTGFIKRKKGERRRSLDGGRRTKENDGLDYGRKKKEKRKDPRDEDPDAKILALGVGMAALAKRQNTLDLMDARKSGVFPVKREDSGRLKGAETSRGIGSSKMDHADEDGWYSDDSDSGSSSVDSKLAYGGSTTNFFGMGGKKPQPFRKSSVVDPNLFGPQNSLAGIVTRPVGLQADELDIGNLSDYRPPTVAEAIKIARRESLPTESIVSGTTSLRQVYPVPTSDPTRFDVASSEHTPRPDPVPLQHPKPYTPVSQSVYDPSYAVSSGREASGHRKTGSVAGAALAGVAGAAIGAAIVSDRREKDRRRDDERDDRDRRERRSTQDYESEKRSSRRRDDRDAPIILDDREARSGREPRDEKRESRRYNDRPDERESRRPAPVTTGVDPFQFQVGADAFPTPDAAKGLGQFPEVKRSRSPAVITVERVPHFARERSDPVKEKASPIDDDNERKERESRDRRRTEREADETYKEIEHFTAPIEIGAIGAAVAAEREAEHRHEREERERRHRRDEDDDSDPRRHREGRRRTKEDESHARSPSRSREPSPSRDPVQDEADRIYREAVLARKIASRKNEKDPVIRITTPPEMEHKLDPSAYDAPNADFLLDHVMDPTEFHVFTPITEPGEYPLPKSIVSVEDENVKANKRPLLTLVRPTPTSSPAPEQQKARSERKKTAEPAQSTEPTKEEKTPTSSNGNRSVTWGENETKHYEPESPQEHRDEFIESTPKAAASTDEAKPKKPSRWGAVKGAFVGAGAAGAVAATHAMVDKYEKESKPEKEESKPKPYEYRGVVVEPDLTDDEKARGPPAVGPKPPSPQPRSPIEAPKVPASHMPGSFGDDLDFTATIAAGLQDSGFDPNIVIDDPKYRRRSSPPGTNDDSKGLYKQPYAETVSDLGHYEDKPDKEISTQKSIIEEVEPSNTSREIEVDPEDEFTTKLTKKEQRKRDKAAKRQSTSDPRDIEPVEETPVTGSLVEEPESYFEPAKSKKDKKSKKSKKSYDDDFDEPAEGDKKRVSVPIDAYDDLLKDDRKPESPIVDEWDTPSSKKSKKKSKRDSESYDSPSRSGAASEVMEEPSSKKSKDKSKRKSEQYEPDVDPADIMLPASEVSTRSDESRKSRKSKRDSSLADDRSTRSDSIKGDEYEPRKSRKSSKRDSSLPDESSQVSSRYADDDDTRSVSSTKKKEKDKKNGGFFGLFGSSTSKSEPEPSKDDFEEPKKKKKSKRSSTVDSDTFVDAPSYSNGNDKYDDVVDSKKASNGDRDRAVNEDDANKKDEDSFLGKAGTLGAGVGLAGAAVAFAAQHHQQSKAALTDDEDEASTHVDPFQYQVADDAFPTPEAGKTTDPFLEYRPLAHVPSEPPETVETPETQSRDMETAGDLEEDLIDPEISERKFRPSIDPQYGDLLPLPPSDPGTPGKEVPVDLPVLPESRPNSPPRLEQFTSRDRPSAISRRSEHHTPMKSPSTSAVPIKFMLGNRSNPSSPRVVGPGPVMSPTGSPAVASPESMSFPSRPRARPTSWEGSKEIQPLILVQGGRKRDSVDLDKLTSPLQHGSDGLRGSGTDEVSSTARTAPDELHEAETSSKFAPGEDVPKHHASSLTSAVIAGSAIGLGAGALVSALADDKEARKDTTVQEHEVHFPEPSPVESVTKDRTSYLFQSTPPTKRFGNFEDSPLEETSQLERGHSPTGDRGLEGSDGSHGPAEHELTDSAKAVQESKDQGSSTIDFATHNEPSSIENKTYDVDKNIESTVQEPEKVDNETPAAQEADPSEEFSFTKSKKGKKDNKKKQTLDQLLAEEEAAPAIPPPVEPIEETEPLEEFSLPKSKKDKKKEKKKTIDQLLAEEEPESSSATFAAPVLEENLPETEPAEDFEFSMPKSKKEKKKSRKSVLELLDEDEVSKEADVEPGPLETPTVEQPEAEYEFAMPKSKKDKKKDKKKGKQQEDEPDSLSSSTVLQPLEREAGKEIDSFEDFPLPKSKKDKKKDKKKGRQQDDEPVSLSSSMVLPIQEDDVSMEAKPAAEISSYSSTVEEDKIPTFDDDGRAPESPFEEAAAEPEPTDEFSFTKSKKDKKKDKKGRKSLSRSATLDDQGPSEPVAALEDLKDDIPESQDGPTYTPLMRGEVVVPEDVVANTGDIPVTPQEPVIVDEPFEEFSSSKSKKDKKKDKKNRKSSQAWDADEAVVSETTKEVAAEVVPEQPVQDEDNFTMPSSKKKGKKGKRQSIAWEDTEEVETPIKAPVLEKGPVDEPVEEPSSISKAESFGVTPSDSEPFGTARSNFSNAEYFPSAAALLPLAAAGATLAALSHDHEGKEPKTEPLKTDSTSPVDRSAVVEETPLATSESSYFPAATSLYEDKQTPPAGTTESRDIERATAQSGSSPIDYFPSAASLHSPKKDSFKGNGDQRGYFPSAAALLPLTAAPAIIAGADPLEPGIVQGKVEDQQPPTLEAPLSKEAPSSVASEKDIGVAPQVVPELDEAEAAAKIPPGYSEDQLEAARQMKADFESGVLGRKKSKKGKKGRLDLSRTSTQDDEVFQTLADEPSDKNFSSLDQEAEHEASVIPDSQNKDGLAAGFKAEQILLAKQLQAEYGTGDKKSKKGKKSRSTSRTPNQDFESRASYFDDEMQFAEPEQIRDIPRDIGSPREASPSQKGPDGLAAGFTAEQLEAARQMREDFSSGSMKTKKELKKDKKRQSLLRTVTDDNMGKPSDEISEENSLDSSELNSPTDSGTSTPNVRDELDEFSFAPKKGKKGKKRQSSLLRTSILDDETAPETSTEPKTAPLDATENVDQVEVGDKTQHEAVEPADEEFSYSLKKSKKDKKGKKRQTSTIDDEKIPQAEPVISRDLDSTKLAVDEEALEKHETTGPADEDFSFSSKKSKKDKKGKKRQTSTFEDEPAGDVETIEPEKIPQIESVLPTDLEITQPVATQEVTLEQETTEPADEDFSFSSKTSKKDKKGKKRQTSTFEDDTSKELAPSALAEVESAQPDVDEAVTSQETTEPAEEEFSFSSKKSKKDKKGKKQRASTFDDEPMVEPVPAVLEDVEAAEQDATEATTKQELIEPTEEDFSSLKKSKKDKKGKKRQTSTFDDDDTPKASQDGLTNQEIIQSDTIEAITDRDVDDTIQFDKADPAEEEFSYSLKKTKKDKKGKKQQSTWDDENIPVVTQDLPQVTELAQPLPAIDTVADREVEDVPLPEPAEPMEDDFSYSVKKSKKDKKGKKRQSSSATPIEHEVATEKQPELFVLDSKTPGLSLADQIWDSVITADKASSPPKVETPAAESDDPFGFSVTSKKSKKEKKKKKGSGVATPFEDDAPIEALQTVVTNDTEAIKSHNQEEATSHDVVTESNANVADVKEPSEEAEDWSGFSTSKKSKKEKKKKSRNDSDILETSDQPKSTAEILGAAADLTATKTAPLSWADEVAEAEDATAKDDKSLPLTSTISSPLEIESRNAVVPEAPNLESVTDNNDDALKFTAAAGAALAGVAILSHGSEKPLEDSKHIEVIPDVQNVKEETLPRPSELARSNSKKGKKGRGKSKSIDRRTSSQDDIFDDPSLWEGAEPRQLGDDKNERDADNGGDFWSIPAGAETDKLENTTPDTTPVISTAERLEREATKDDPQNAEPPRQVSQLRQMFEKETPQTREILREAPQIREELQETAQVREQLGNHEIPQNREPSRETPQSREDSVIHEIAQTRELPSGPEIPQTREALDPITDVTEPGHKRAHNEVVDAALVAAGIHTPAAIDEALEQSATKVGSYQSGGVVPEQQWNDLPDDFITKPSKKSKKNKKQSRLAAWDVPTKEGESTVVEAPMSSIPQPEPITAPVDTQKQGWSFPAVQPEEPEHDTEEPRSTEVHEPDSYFDDHDAHEHERNMPMTPENRSYDNLRNQDHRWSTPTPLPVVMEEEDSPQQPRFVKTSPEPELRSRDRGREDTNRDSGLVTGSPIPLPRTAFRDDHEDVRDSGVHLREWAESTPTKEKREIISTDDALARMSWPAVDEESETVDLDRSQRRKEQSPPKHHSPQGSAIGAAAALAGAGIAVKGARAVSDRFEDRDGDKKVRAERRSVSDKFEGKGSDKKSYATDRRSISPNFVRLQTPDQGKHRPESVGSNRSTASGTPPLRRSDRKLSGDLRSLSQRSQLNLAKEAAREAEFQPSPATSIISATPIIANEGRVRAKDMADVYDGFGEGRIGSPMSPTRPHSMRRRQSMQVLDLEARLDHLAAENRALAEAKAFAEQSLLASQRTTSILADREAEVDNLKQTIDWLHKEVEKLKEVNDGLTSANITIGQQHSQRYDSLAEEHEQATRDLDQVRTAHGSLSAGMESIIRNEVDAATHDKDLEIEQLRRELEAAKQQIREMQKQILAAKANDGDFLVLRDEDYFDTACQQLCQHVQQWVLRFSKFSDMRACRLTSEINNDKTIDRLDNAVLDGSDVDSYLSDRVKRRDIFMSMTMTMIWEFVFTRYLFGMDREQRQKLKALEKTLTEVGPPSAVHQWRATTLTLLAKRTAFVQQREQDTEAVVQLVFQTLSEILPPPTQLEDQIQDQLRRVMKAAVDLSIEMRTQRAEYMMLPPLQPEYDANGDLAQQVHFNAALMNERSGDTSSNEELEAQQAVVRVVLFPLVVKKGDDTGEGDDEIVVCPAQVLVAKPKKQVRVFSPEAMDLTGNHSRISMQSGMPQDI